MANKTESKRLAKNTVYMYFRMFLLMIISLYTSRVVLQYLGISNYGIYNVVGSIVSLFTSLRSVFSSATQRFLNYEIGSGNTDKLNLIFNLSNIVNGVLALIFVAVVELIGLWFLNDKINVEPDRLNAAFWVFQCSVIAVVFNFLTIPYDACIIAHEKMNYYAFISILEGFLKLVIIFLLPLFPFDRLIVYGILVMLVSIIIRLVCQIYCRNNFEECRLRRLWDKDYFKKMTSFAGWAFLGNTAYALCNNGMNMILNVFGGPIINAARGIAYQVHGLVEQFTSNIIVVVRPFATKVYASGDMKKVYLITYMASKVYFSVNLFITVCISFLAPYLLSIWLGDVPEYTITFVRLVVVYGLIRTLNSPFNVLFTSSGNIKYYQIGECVVITLPIVFSYFLLSSGWDYSIAFYTMIVSGIIDIVFLLYLSHKQCGLPVLPYVFNVIVRLLPPIILTLVSYFICIFYCDGFWLTIIDLIVCLTLNVAVIAFLVFTKNERSTFLSIIKK